MGIAVQPSPPLLLYVGGACVAAGDGDGDIVEATSSMEEGDHSGIGEHAAGGVPASGGATENNDVPAEAGGGGEAATANGVPAATGGIPVGPSGGGT